METDSNFHAMRSLGSTYADLSPPGHWQDGWTDGMDVCLRRDEACSGINQQKIDRQVRRLLPPRSDVATINGMKRSEYKYQDREGGTIA